MNTIFNVFWVAIYIILYFFQLIFQLFIITLPVALFFDAIIFCWCLYKLYHDYKILIRKSLSFATEDIKTDLKKRAKKLIVNRILVSLFTFVPVLDFFPWPVIFFINSSLDKMVGKLLIIDKDLSAQERILRESEVYDIDLKDDSDNQDDKIYPIYEKNSIQKEDPIQRIERERQAKKVNSDSGLSKKGQTEAISKTQIANQNNSQIKNNIKNRKTIDEEVGGIKTGQEFSDYDTDYKGKKIVDNNNPEYYENILSARNKKEKEDQEKKREMQGLQKKKSLGEELAQMTRILSSAQEKYGKDSGIVKNLKNKYEKMNPESRKGIDELTIGSKN